MPREPLDRDQIIAFMDECLEVEFSFLKNEIPAEHIVRLDRAQQDFVLNLVSRVAGTNIELAYQFAMNAIAALEAMDMHMVETWAMHATDLYDRKGLFPAMSVMRNLEDYVQTAHQHAAGALLDEEAAILLPFLHGLSGRKLKLAEDDHAWTDTETVYLPPVIAKLPEESDNFLIYKATAAHLWAQIRFGTFRTDLVSHLESSADADVFLRQFSTLERIRLDACIRRELPGLYRDMLRLRELLQEEDPQLAGEIMQALQRREADVTTTLEYLEYLDLADCPPPVCYQAVIRPVEVADTMTRRVEREKAYFRVALSDIAKEIQPAFDQEDADADDEAPRFVVKKKHEDALTLDSSMSLELNDISIAPPEHVRELITSIIVDFGEIPPEYLVAAGPGEYDLRKYEDGKRDPNDVWQGTYHEEGAELYNEWNFKRQHYHKNWCVLREVEVTPEYSSFVGDTLQKYGGVLKSLRHTFEILRGEHKLLKKQPYGDDIDVDALVEAWGDVHAGLEMSERVFTKMHKDERNVAVLFLVDMSGSTRGWINRAEREALVLLCEVLEILDDRYAIYGFSGMTRKRCELFRVKSFEEPYDDEVRARISNIKPQDYTRMGVFIRHAIRAFRDVEASTKLMITLSDGKPDDYDNIYRGEYGVEDTRQALFEARREGIHSFCITIDEKAREYLPHMYGAANYTVIDDVAKLPMKVSDIYRRITTK